MASGFKSCHPVTVELLKQLGVEDGDVTQGVGAAAASAGTHNQVGAYQGVKYGPCVDLRYSLANPDFIARLWQAGLVAFVRDAASGWSGSRHIHAVCLGLVDDAGNKHLPPICNTQVTDFLHSPPRSGLAGHGYLQGAYKPTPAMQKVVAAQYKAWFPGYATKVLSPEGHIIPCYAQLEGDVVTADETRFFEYWGKTMGQFVPAGTVFDGRFYRAPVRAMCDLLKLKIASFTLNKQKTAATVQLSY